MKFNIPNSIKTIILNLCFIVFLLAQNDALNDRFSFLQQIYFENTNQQYSAYLKIELENFLQKTPDFDQSDQIIWMLADVLGHQHKTYRALINYLKIPVLFPKSKIAPDVRKKLRTILTHVKNAALFEQKDSILDYANKPHFFETRGEALIDLYNFLFSLNISCLKPMLLQELNQFENYCDLNNNQRDILVYLKGSLNEDLKHYASAEANYRELTALYKSSALYPAAMLKTGLLDYRHLKKFSDAQNAFLQVINSFPNDENAAKAQFYLAELYADSLDSVAAGIDNYRVFLEAFPDKPLFNKAFKRLTLLLFKAKRYEEAVTLIGINLNKHPGDSSFYALVDSMARVFKTHFKKYNYAARCYVLLASNNPQSRKSPFYLYSAAQIYYKKLKDVGRAKDICLRLKKNYPQSPFTKKCIILLKQRAKK